MSPCEAIAGTRVVRFEYGGGLRTVEPHAHGWSLAGVELLRGYQTFGFSASGGSGWRTFHVARIVGLRAMEERFGVRPDFREAGPGMTRIHCSV